MHRPSGNPARRAARAAAATLAVIASLLAGPPASATEAGLRTLRVPYEGTTIDVVISYPSSGTETPLAAGPFSPVAVADGPLAAGTHPLVILSHGTGGMNLNHHTLAGALARAGFVVAALTHPGDNFRDRSLIADPRYFHERPRQASRVLDALLADAEWSAHLDRERIAALGHSAGGFTALALAGATPDPARLYAHCRAGADDPACAYRDPGLGVTDPAAHPYRLRDDARADGATRDPRVRAVVLLAPLGAVFDPAELARVRVPVRLVGAEHDEVLARRYHYDLLREHVRGADASLVPGAGHFAFIAPVGEAWRAALGPVAADPAGFDRTALHARLGAELAQWLSRALAR